MTTTDCKEEKAIAACPKSPLALWKPVFLELLTNSGDRHRTAFLGDLSFFLAKALKLLPQNNVH